ncbi:NAD-binding protein, partial [Phellopilus nigrolimitatus]
MDRPCTDSNRQTLAVAAMPPIKTCVLGVGLSGLAFHVPFILALPDVFELHAVLERNPSSDSGKVKDRFGVDVKIHRSIEDVLADDQIELVVVGTPNATHYDYVKRSLQANKHVLVDKPAVTTAAEARELGELARTKNRVLYAYQNRRWDSDFLSLKRLLKEPASSSAYLGDLFEYESHYDRYRNGLKGTWKDDKLAGAGQLYDLGTHLIDQVVSLFGRPQKVTGFVENVRGLGDPDVDDSFTLVLHYAKTEERKYPIKALLRAHILSVRDPQLRFVVRGTEGSYVKYGLDVQEDQLKAVLSPEDIYSEEYGKEPENIWGEVNHINGEGTVSKIQWPALDRGAYIELFYNLADAIRADAELKVKWDEVTTVLEIIELAHQSSREGRTISLS